jgi:hypothetical protein
MRRFSAKENSRSIGSVAVVWVFVAASVAGTAIAAQHVWSVLEASVGPTPLLFPNGLSSVDPAAPPEWTNEQCGTCHQKAFDEWKSSRHYVAGTAYNFEVECLEESGGRQQYCLNCHAPNVSDEGLLPIQVPEGLDALFQENPDWLVQGVDCISCHVRDGKVLGTNVTPQAEAAHPMRHAPELASPEFCAGCHQFAYKDGYLPDHFRGQFQQASLDEFLDYSRKEQLDMSCRDCHMPDGDHEMPGGYSVEMLQSAVELDLTTRWREELGMVEVEATLAAVGAGHRIPGGEEFRFLTLRTSIVDAQGNVLSPEAKELVMTDPANIELARQSPQVPTVAEKWPIVESMRRLMGDFERGIPNARPLKDTRLWPGEEREFRYLIPVRSPTPESGARVRAEVWYHVMDDIKARKMHHSEEDVMWMIVRKEQPLPAGGASESE